MPSLYYDENALQAFFDSEPAFQSEYARVRASGDRRSALDWLWGHVGASPGDQEKYGVFLYGEPEPSIIQQVFQDTAQDFAAPSVPPDFFYDVPSPPPLPPIIEQILTQMFPPPAPPASPTVTPQEQAQIPALGGGTGPAGGGVVIAPTNTTNNIFNQVVNYFFPSPEAETAGSGTPAGGGAGANPAELGKVVTPDTKLAGQVVDQAQNKPTGRTVADAITAPFGSMTAGWPRWAVVLAVILVPVVVLALVWVGLKIFRRGR